MSTSARTPRRLLKALFAASLAGTLLSGCTGHPGTTAVIGGERISDDDVAVVAKEMPLVFGKPANQTEAAVTLLVTEAARQAAAENGIYVGAADVQAALQQFGMADVKLSEQTQRVLAQTLITQKAKAAGKDKAIGQRMNELLITSQLNPRYKIDVTQGGPAAQPAWLSDTAPADSAQQPAQ